MRLHERAGETTANPALPLYKLAPALGFALAFVHVRCQTRDLSECLVQRVDVLVRGRRTASQLFKKQLVAWDTLYRKKQVTLEIELAVSWRQTATFQVVLDAFANASGQ